MQHRSTVCCCSVIKSCPTLCNPTDCRIPDFPVLLYFNLKWNLKKCKHTHTSLQYWWWPSPGGKIESWIFVAIVSSNHLKFTTRRTYSFMCWGSVGKKSWVAWPSPVLFWVLSVSWFFSPSFAELKASHRQQSRTQQPRDSGTLQAQRFV